MAQTDFDTLYPDMTDATWLPEKIIFLKKEDNPAFEAHLILRTTLAEERETYGTVAELIRKSNHIETTLNEFTSLTLAKIDWGLRFAQSPEEIETLRRELAAEKG